MRRMTKAGSVAAALAMIVGLAACGDDDDASTDTTAPDAGEETADAAAFCEGLVEFNGKVLAIEVDEESSEEEVKAAGQELAPLADEMASNAPESVADAWSDLNDDVIQPLLDGDAEAFNSDETFEDYTALVADVTGECGYEALDVTAVDYAFEGVPATMPAGTYALELTNSGTEQHEMIVFRKADGVTQSIEEIVNLPEEETESLVVFSGAAFAPPGESGSSLAQLEPGQYGMVCFIPVGSTADADPEEGGDGPPHFTQGMLTEFTVE